MLTPFTRPGDVVVSISNPYGNRLWETRRKKLMLMKARISVTSYGVIINKQREGVTNENKTNT